MSQGQFMNSIEDFEQSIRDSLAYLKRIKAQEKITALDEAVIHFHTVSMAWKRNKIKELKKGLR